MAKDGLEPAISTHGSSATMPRDDSHGPERNRARDIIPEREGERLGTVIHQVICGQANRMCTFSTQRLFNVHMANGIAKRCLRGFLPTGVSIEFYVDRKAANGFASLEIDTSALFC